MYFLVPGMPIFIPGIYHPWLPAYHLWNISAAQGCWLIPLEILLVPVLLSANRIDWYHCIVTWHLCHACPTSCLPFSVLWLATPETCAHSWLIVPYFWDLARPCLVICHSWHVFMSLACHIHKLDCPSSVASHPW
jgi:hypothetical protein